MSFRAFFEHAPIAVARCNSEGVIVEMNPAFERSLDPAVASRRSLRLCELVRPQDRDKTDLLLRDLLGSRCEAMGIEVSGAGHGQESAKWTAWRQAGSAGEPGHALLIAEPIAEQFAEQIAGQMNDTFWPGESPLQTHKWEAIGRLAGGVVHDFNNLLTGVMLYCDLLLSSLDARDRRRRYADEIRSAIVQATGLVHQLLACVRPQPATQGLLSLNEIAGTMQDLLTRLVGEKIVLELRLDPELGAIKIARAQAQQIILNLVLNARDALPEGGRITVQTSNCGFQPVAGAPAPNFLPAFPCVLLTVADNGHGMNAETRRRLFEPFFTTRGAAQGSGLGLTTVRGIVTTNHGLIHFDSEAGRGTRALILFPRSVQSADAQARVTDSPDSSHPDSDNPDSGKPDSALSSPTPFHEIKKESLI
jgi:two-component system cell cycle sensor histidine kinase/response regulator CckA